MGTAKRKISKDRVNPLQNQEQWRQIKKVRDEPRLLYESSGYSDYQVAMRDGVKLMTHVCLPQGKGPWPTVLMRTPYVTDKQNRFRLELLSTFGYAVVCQECRGRGASGGEWRPFVYEREDGLDTLQWLIRQDWTNGRIGLYGHSYTSVILWLIAAELPEQVKTLYLMQGGPERYRQMYMNGMFRHDIYTVWTICNSGVKTETGPGTLYDQALRVRPHIEMDVRVFGTKLPWYRDWVTQPAPDNQLWSEGLWAQLQQAPGKVRIPVCLVAGWFDHHLDGMLQAYDHLPEKIKRQSRLVIGPWDHKLQSAGNMDYPGSRKFGTMCFNDLLAWFDSHLKSAAAGRAGDVETYVVGQNEWRKWDNWPPKVKLQHLYLDVANDCKAQGGVLTPNPPARRGSLVYKYDPDHPTPTRGGSVLMSWLTPGLPETGHGILLQPEPGYRADVLSFISGPAPADFVIAGNIKVYLSIASDAEDTAFTVKIMEIHPDGNAYNIGDGITSLAYRNDAARPRHYKPGNIVNLCIELWTIIWRIPKGSGIRLDISSSNFPAYHIHPNVTGIWAEQSTVKVATQTVFWGKDFKSYVEIPIIP
jgi:putative CocE/NonD family hydrolase